MAERAEIKKLSKKLKREKKGALKELRKDTQFLAAQKQKDKDRQSKRSSEATKRVMTDLYNQQRDSNIWAREGKKKRDKGKK